MKIANYFVLAAVVILIATCSCGRVPYDVVENDPIAPIVDSPSDLRKHKTVFVKPSKYYNAGPIRKLMRGENYRDIWDAPVHVPILWLDTLYGGLTIVDEGGGGQSRSLELKDGRGHFYKLRSIGKNPTVNVPKFAMAIGMGQLVADVTSAGHPYGALAAASLAETAGIPHTHPSLYYLPRQTTLDTFNDRFGNRLFLLEYDAQGSKGEWVKNEQPIKDMPKWEDVKKNLSKDSKHRVDQETLLRARLLDFVIGDWDRHTGNWGWAMYQKGDETRYLPIAVDRDMVFFKLEGVLPWLITRSFLEPRYRPYRKKIRYLPRMIANSKELHAVALNRMTADDFQEQAKKLQTMLTAEKVEQALHTWPDTIYTLNAKEVREKILSIRNDLPTYAAKFYKLVSERIEVAGTAAADIFQVLPGPNGELKVQVKSFPQKDKPVLHYERSFDPKVTETIILLGMDGDDTFELGNGTYGKTKIIIVGDKGSDKVTEMQAAKGAQKRTQVFDNDKMELPDGYQKKEFKKNQFYWTLEEE